MRLLLCLAAFCVVANVIVCVWLLRRITPQVEASIFSSKTEPCAKSIDEDKACKTSVQNTSFVFIGIKTSDVGVHAERLPQIELSWQKDALANNMIELKFFSHSNVNKTGTRSSPLVISTPCHGMNLACKTAKVFYYFLHNTTAAWFCSFDDDNYVIVDNLIKLLKTYNPTNDLYVGKPVVRSGIFFQTVNATILHGTGGAGYCLSRPLVERGEHLFSNLQRFHLPDDVAVAYVSQVKLGVNLTASNLLHSHYERNIRLHVHKDDIGNQISFGRENKPRNLISPERSMPDVPLLFPHEEDPFSFRSLWCFLHPEKRDLPECTPSPTAERHTEALAFKTNIITAV